MVEAEELIVAIRSEGVGETQDDLEGVEESMEQTADSAGDSAEELQGFSEQFEGAMGAAVAALAVGAAGLLSQVPVLGELFSGLAAVVSALAFQMDGVLRPVLSPLTDFFFELSAAIFEADGILGDLIGAIASIGAAVAIAVPLIAKAGALLGVWASTGAGVVSILGTIVGAITTVGAAIVSLPGLIAVAIAAIIGFVVAYLTNFRGMRDKTDAFVADIIDFVVSGFKSFISDAIEAVSGFKSDVVEFFSGIASDISEWASDLADDAFDFGVSIITSLIEGIESFSQSVVDALVGILNDIIRSINTTLDVLPDEITSRIGVEEFDTISPQNVTAEAPTRSTANTPSGRPPAGGTGGVSIDGRQLTESTGRYLSDAPRRQGL